MYHFSSVTLLGGMPTPDPAQAAQMMQDPMVQQQMQQMLNDPQALEQVR
jgi:hypothetical protein